MLILTRREKSWKVISGSKIETKQTSDGMDTFESSVDDHDNHFGDLKSK